MDHGKSFLRSLTAEVDSSETIFVSSVHPGIVPAPLRLCDLFSIASHAVSAPRTDSSAASVSAHRNPTMNESAIVRLTPVQRPAIFRLCANRSLPRIVGRFCAKSHARRTSITHIKSVSQTSRQSELSACGIACHTWYRLPYIDMGKLATPRQHTFPA
jgi:hypothetical protein